MQTRYGALYDPQTGQVRVWDIATAKFVWRYLIDARMQFALGLIAIGSPGSAREGDCD